MGGDNFTKYKITEELSKGNVKLIPDVLIGVGYLDDATIVAFCLKLVQKEIEKYQEWAAVQAKGRGGPVVDI